jgi:molybdopterin synthase sulfur carrier subunit
MTPDPEIHARAKIMKLRYFAWVRERVGKTEEDVEVPGGVGTIGELMAWLATRGEEYAHAFDNPKVIRAAIDKTHVQAAAPIKGAREIAFFPPMTGG